MRKIIVEGNSVYEIDEDALLKKRSEHMADDQNSNRNKFKRKGLTENEKEKKRT